MEGIAYLLETNVGGLLTEALTADVQAVLADETGLVGADTAVKKSMLAHPVLYAAPSLAASAMIPASEILATGQIVDIPLPGALAVGAWARKPDALVRHICGCFCRLTEGTCGCAMSEMFSRELSNMRRNVQEVEMSASGSLAVSRLR